MVRELWAVLLACASEAASALAQQLMGTEPGSRLTNVVHAFKLQIMVTAHPKKR